MDLKRFFTVAFVLFLLLFQLGGISKAGLKDAKYIWKMATHAPEAIGYAVYIKKHMHPAVEKATNGEVAFDWYWGGIMGDNEDWIAKIQIDQLQGGGFDGHGTVLVAPDTAVFELPFLFNGVDEVTYVKEKMDERIVNIFEKKGYKVLLFQDQGNEGFDEIYSTKKPIQTPDDLVKSRVLSWCGHVEAETLKAFNASPIPVNVPEVVTSLRSGVCDVALAPAMWWVGSQLYTITKYITQWKLRYQPATIAVSTKAWDKIPQEYQKRIDEMLPDIAIGLNEYAWDTSKKCVKAMVKYGVKEVELTPDEIAVFKNKSRPVWDKLAGKDYSRELLDEVLGYIEEYRSKSACR